MVDLSPCPYEDSSGVRSRSSQASFGPRFHPSEHTFRQQKRFHRRPFKSHNYSSRGNRRRYPHRRTQYRILSSIDDSNDHGSSRHTRRYPTPRRCNPTDPLNLDTTRRHHSCYQQRQSNGSSSPHPGHGCGLGCARSGLSTPVGSQAATPNTISVSQNDSLSQAHRERLPPLQVQRVRRNDRRFNNYRRRNRHNRRNRFPLPKSGNFPDYYERRPLGARLPYFLPEWFTGKDVADYGCHSGQFALAMLKKFPDVQRIDAFDKDANIIANAKSLQRETIRWNSEIDVPYHKVNFIVTDWATEDSPFSTEFEYDTIVALSVTKWIHLDYGDSGLLRFFRRAFTLLKPGGRLILEPQPKTSYRNSLMTTIQAQNYRTLRINPSKLEPLLAEIGFSYFDTIKPLGPPGQPFNRPILLCERSHGCTPASIRNRFRQAVFESPASQQRSPSPAQFHLGNPADLVPRPPPVAYSAGGIDTPYFANTDLSGQSWTASSPLGLLQSWQPSSSSQQLTSSASQLTPNNNHRPSSHLASNMSSPFGNGSLGGGDFEPDSTTSPRIF